MRYLITDWLWSQYKQRLGKPSRFKWLKWYWSVSTFPQGKPMLRGFLFGCFAAFTLYLLYLVLWY